jgi:hypothetical protein
MADQQEPGHEGAPGGHMTAVKLPPFWHRSPASWFRTVEALFVLKGVMDNVERYYQVMAALTEELADMVGSVVDEEPTQEAYARIKAALVATNILTPYQMVDKLMAMEPLGDRKATELLTAMQKLRPPTDDQFFAWAFLQCLPREVRVLLAQDDHADMRKLAEKADALLALHQPQTHDINAIAASSVAAGNLQPATDAGEDTVAAASAGKGGQGGKKKKKRSGHPRRRSRSPADFKSPLCQFHVRYGDKAYRCKEPCAWPGN